MTERPIIMSAPMVRAILAGRKTQTRRLVNLDTLSVTLPRLVRADVPGTPSARSGRYRATLNQNGAVSVLRASDKFGVKPGEFDFVCPYAEGVTRIRGNRSGWEVVPHPDQRLWVKETWTADDSLDLLKPSDLAATVDLQYIADGKRRKPQRSFDRGKTRPAIFMPRWASRLTLSVAGVRLQRVQEITEEDARAEGMVFHDGGETGHTGWRHDPGYGFVEGTAKGAFFALWRLLNGEASLLANPFTWVIDFPAVTA